MLDSSVCVTVVYMCILLLNLAQMYVKLTYSPIHMFCLSPPPLVHTLSPLHY